MPATAAAARSIWSKPTPARTMMRQRLRAETKAASIFISCQTTRASQALSDSSDSSRSERARRMSQSTSTPAVWRSMTPSSAYCASGVSRRNRAMAILCFGSEPVMAERVAAEELVLLALGEGGDDPLERSVERIEGAIELVDRKVAAEHRPVDAEPINDSEHEGPDARLDPTPVDHAEAGDLGDDIWLGGKALHAVAPKREAGLIALERHTGMVDDDQRLWIAAGKLGRVAHLRRIELEVERKPVFAEQAEAGKPGAVGQKIVVGEGIFGVWVPVDDVADAAHFRKTQVLDDDFFSVGLLKLDAGDDAAREPFAVRCLLQPASLDQWIGRHRLDVHRADDVVVRGVGAIVPEEIVARDRLEVAEHALAGRLVLKPGIVIAAAEVPEVVVSVDDLSLGHRLLSCQSRSSRRVRKRCARIAASTATPKAMLRTPCGMAPMTSTVVRMVVNRTAIIVPP